MKKLTIATAILAATTATVAINANAYQAEVGGSYTYLDGKDNYANGDNGTISGKYYFKNVQTRNSPLAEAAFLDRASNVGANVSYTKYDDTADTKYTNYGVSGEYFIPNSNFYVGGNVGQNEIKQTYGNTKYKDKATVYGAEVGYLPVHGLLLAVGAQGYHYKDDTTGKSENGADPTLRAKYVTSLSNGKDINLEGKAVFGDKDKGTREYSVGGDYYFDKTFSAGVDYVKNAAEEDGTVGLRAKKFINPNWSVDGRVGFGSDNNAYTVGTSFRF